MSRRQSAIRLRIAKQLKILPFNRYEHWAARNDEIGRLIGGWLRSLDPERARTIREPAPAAQPVALPLDLG